jgi:hypothetical protein
MMKSTTKNKKKHSLLFFCALIISGFVLLFTAVIAIGIYLGFQTHSDIRINNKITELLKQSGVDSCSLKSTRFTPWRGLEVDSLYFSAPMNNELYVKSSIDTLGIRYDIKTVLKYVYRYRKTILHSVVSGDFTIGPFNNKMLVSEILPLIDNIHAKGKNVEFTNVITHESFTIDKFILNTRTSGWINPQRNGHIESEMLQYGKWSIRKAVAELQLKGDSISVNITKASFLKGYLTLDTWIGMSPLRIKTLNIKGDSLSIDEYCAIRKKYMGNISGIADLSMSFENSPIIPDSLHGNGRLTMKKVLLRDLPVQKALVNLIGFPQLANTPFDSIRTDYTMKPGMQFKSVMKGTGPVFQFTSTGPIYVDGRLEQQIDGKLTKEFVETLPGIISESMEPTPDNGRKFKCRIYGSIDHPKMSLSKESLQKAFMGAFDSVKKSIEEVFK